MTDKQTKDIVDAINGLTGRVVVLSVYLGISFSCLMILMTMLVAK